MKHFFKITLFFLLPIFLFTSCNDEPEVIYSCFSTVVVGADEVQPEFPYRFVSDDSLVIYPSNYKEMTNYQPVNNERCIVYFTFTPDNNVYYFGNIQMVEDVLTKDIVKVHSPDTLGTDGADALSMWTSGGIYGADRYLTIKFSYFASKNLITHKVNLATDTTVVNPIVDGYYCLDFHHDAEGDFPNFATYGYVTFPLKGEYVAPGIKGLRIKFNNLLDEDVTYHKIDY